MRLLALLVGCEGAPADTGTGPLPPADCFDESGARLELSLESGSFDDVEEGMTAPVSVPPQGGAPYTPWMVRVTGDGALNGGVRMVATASDDDVEVGDVEIDLVPICANVAPNDGWWMVSGVHVRYWEYTVDELIGRAVDFHFSLQDVGGGAERGSADLSVVLAAADEPGAL